MPPIEPFENECASSYDQFVEHWIPNYHYFLDQLPSLFNDVPVRSLLVAGCGTGNEILRFIPLKEPWEITGIDPSPEMIQQAKTKFQEYPNVSLLTGPLADLPKDQQFGAATLLLVLHFIKDDGSKLDLLKQIAAHLSPGAPFVLFDITGDAASLKANLNILRRLLPTHLEQEEVDQRLNRIQNEFYPVSERRLEELCLDAGFEAPLRFFQNSVYMGWIMHKK